MNYRRLEYFLTMANSESLAQAAVLLKISPPALSKAMKLLEEECEVKLFIMNGRRLKLSDAGASLLQRAPKLVDELRALKESLHSNPKALSPLKLGTFEVFSTYFLEKISELDIPLELHEVLPGELERYVLSSHLDFGITYMPIPDSELDFLKVGKIEMGVFTRKDAFKDVAQSSLPYVVPVFPLQGAPTKVKGLDGWPDWAYRRKVMYQVTLMESALELCRLGKCAGYFPAFVVQAHNERVRGSLQLERRRLPNSQACFSDVYIVKRKSTLEDSRIKQMARILRSICAK